MNDPLVSEAGAAEPSRTCEPAAPTAATPAAGDALAADDPQGTLRRALAGPFDPASAADAVLDWLLRLPDGSDPAPAAARVLADRDAASAGNESLSRLLAEIARWPADRLNGLQRRRLRLPQ